MRCSFFVAVDIIRVFCVWEGVKQDAMKHEAAYSVFFMLCETTGQFMLRIVSITRINYFIFAVNWCYFGLSKVPPKVH